MQSRSSLFVLKTLILMFSGIIHWYNQRAECSENRIKELKLDFGVDRMPCSDFHANALYFSLCSLAYSLFAFMRRLLPSCFESVRAKTIRWQLYAIAGKIVKHAGKIYLKVKKSHRILLESVFASFAALGQAP